MGYSSFGCLHIFLFNFLSVVAMYSHFRGKFFFLMFYESRRFLQDSSSTDKNSFLTAMTTDPGSVPKGALPTLDDDYENDTEAVDRYT